MMDKMQAVVPNIPGPDPEELSQEKPVEAEAHSGTNEPKPAAQPQNLPENLAAAAPEKKRPAGVVTDKPLVPNPNQANSLPPDKPLAGEPLGTGGPPPKGNSFLAAFKDRLPLIAAVIFSLLLLSTAALFLSRRSRKTKPQKTVELTYWGLWEPSGVINGAIADFEKSHPNIKIKFKLNTAEDYQARLENSLARNQGPDIFRIHVTWLPVFANLLQPVPAKTAQKLGLDKNYFAVIPESLKVNGQYYALPLMVDNLALFYNRKILAAANLKPPRTWWGLEEAVKKLTTYDANKRIKISGVALGTTNNVDHWSDIVGLMLYQNGVDLRHPEKSAKALAEALSFYTVFSRRDKVWDETLPASTLAFASGRLAFYFAPSWRIFDLQEMNPKLQFATAPVPKLPQNVAGIDMAQAETKGKLNEVNWASFWVEAVNRHSPHAKESWEFLQYLAGKQGLQRLYQAESQIRAFGEIYPRRDLAAGLDANPLLRPFIKQADTSHVWYLASATHDNGPNETMIKYFTDAINAINQGISADQAVKTLLSGISQVRSRYRLP